MQPGIASGRFKDIPRLNHLEELASGGLSSQIKAAHGRDGIKICFLKTLEKILRPLSTTLATKACPINADILKYVNFDSKEHVENQILKIILKDIVG